MNTRNAVVAVSLLLLAASSALAQDSSESRWSVQFGPAYVQFHESASFNVAGSQAVGAGADLQNNTTLAAEVSYRFTPSFAVGLTVGIPARTRITGTGTAEAFGEMGAAQYGPMALTGRYIFNGLGKWHPYVGAGITYYVVLKEHDAFISNLKIDNAFGGVAQAGLQYDIDNRTGVFFDVKKLFVKTTATGNLPALGGVPLSSDVKLNPTVFQLGVSYRF